MKTKNLFLDFPHSKLTVIFQRANLADQIRKKGQKRILQKNRLGIVLPWGFVYLPELLCQQLHSFQMLLPSRNRIMLIVLDFNQPTKITRFELNQLSSRETEYQRRLLFNSKRN